MQSAHVVLFLQDRLTAVDIPPVTYRDLFPSISSYKECFYFVICMIILIYVSVYMLVFVHPCVHEVIHVCTVYVEVRGYNLGYFS